MYLSKQNPIPRRILTSAYKINVYCYPNQKTSPATSIYFTKKIARTSKAWLTRQISKHWQYIAADSTLWALEARHTISKCAYSVQAERSRDKGNQKNIITSLASQIDPRNTSRLTNWQYNPYLRRILLLLLSVISYTSFIPQPTKKAQKNLNSPRRTFKQLYPTIARRTFKQL